MGLIILLSFCNRVMFEVSMKLFPVISIRGPVLQQSLSSLSPERDCGVFAANLSLSGLFSSSSLSPTLRLIVLLFFSGSAESIWHPCTEPARPWLSLVHLTWHQILWNEIWMQAPVIKLSPIVLYGFYVIHFTWFRILIKPDNVSLSLQRKSKSILRCHLCQLYRKQGVAEIFSY